MPAGLPELTRSRRILLFAIISLSFLLGLLWLQLHNDDLSRTTTLPGASAQFHGSESTLHIPPPNEVQVEVTPNNVCEMPEFKDGAPRLKITIFAFAWRRLTSL